MLLFRPTFTATLPPVSSNSCSPPPSRFEPNCFSYCASSAEFYTLSLHDALPISSQKSRFSHLPLHSLSYAGRLLKSGSELDSLELCTSCWLFCWPRLLPFMDVWSPEVIELLLASGSPPT